MAFIELPALNETVWLPIECIIGVRQTSDDILYNSSVVDVALATGIFTSYRVRIPTQELIKLIEAKKALAALPKDGK